MVRQYLLTSVRNRGYTGQD